MLTAAGAGCIALQPWASTCVRPHSKAASLLFEMCLDNDMGLSSLNASQHRSESHLSKPRVHVKPTDSCTWWLALMYMVAVQVPILKAHLRGKWIGGQEWRAGNKKRSELISDYR